MGGGVVYGLGTSFFGLGFQIMCTILNILYTMGLFVHVYYAVAHFYGYVLVLNG